MAIKRKLGAKKRTEEPSTAIAELEAVEQSHAAARSINLNVPVEHIRTVFNPRITYITLDQARKTEWPDLGLDVDEVEPALEKCLEKAGCFEERSSEERTKMIEFFFGIHLLSCSLARGTQAQPVVLERQNPANLNDYALVAGERRTLAAIYSGGIIKTLEAKVYEEQLTPEQRAEIQDAENFKETLTYYETMRSKLAIFERMSAEEQEMSLVKLAPRLGYKTKSSVSLVRNLARHPERKELLNKLAQGWGQRELQDFFAKENEQKGKSGTRKKASPKKPAGHKVETNVLAQLLIKASEADPAIKEALSGNDLSNNKGIKAALKAISKHWANK